MKNLEYYCMALVFLVAGISALTWFGSGFHTWVWQVSLMMWIGLAYTYKRRLDKKL